MRSMRSIPLVIIYSIVLFLLSLFLLFLALSQRLTPILTPVSSFHLSDAPILLISQYSIHFPIRK